MDTLPFDIRYQYVLHTTSFEEQPLNDRTLGRFRARCNSYEEMTGIDLIYDCIIKLSSKKLEDLALPEGLLHYTEDDDHNGCFIINAVKI